MFVILAKKILNSQSDWSRPQRFAWFFAIMYNLQRIICRSKFLSANINSSHGEIYFFLIESYCFWITFFPKTKKNYRVKGNNFVVSLVRWKQSSSNCRRIFLCCCYCCKDIPYLVKRMPLLNNWRLRSLNFLSIFLWMCDFKTVDCKHNFYVLINAC